MKGVRKMKLVELLACELKEWPVVDGVEPNYIVQEGDKELYSTTIRPIYRGSTTWHRAPEDHGDECGYFDVITSDLAEDRSVAIVTRSDRSAERARIAKPANKAAKDGWIRHRGGKCPVEEGVMVDVRHRDGEVFSGFEAVLSAPAGSWNHANHPGDIMAYRLHKPAEQVEACSKPELRSLPENYGEIIGGSVEGPIQWRDRITEIDATTQALTAERADLVQKLASEGFALIGRVVEPVEDMSDWRNWKVGDIVECVSHNERWSAKFAIGSVNVIKEIITDSDVAVELTINIGYYVSPYDFKFHSRPSA